MIKHYKLRIFSYKINLHITSSKAISQAFLLNNGAKKDSVIQRLLTLAPKVFSDTTFSLTLASMKILGKEKDVRLKYTYVQYIFTTYLTPT